MNLTSPKTIKELLKKYDAKALKGLGQNFLIDASVLAKILKAANVGPEDAILEIGPGIGTLTQELAKHASQVVAIEKGAKMVEILSETLTDFKNVQVISEDALKFDPQHSALAGKPYKLIANLPYYITSPVIRKFLETEHGPKLLVLMVQKEVAQRICVAPPDMSILAVSVQYYATPKIISHVSKNCFWPAPKIDSAIIAIEPQNTRTKEGSGAFFKVVKAGFAQPRKQLAGNLSKNLKKSRAEIEEWLLKNNLNPQQRAETLSIQDWLNLVNSFSS